MTNLEVSPRSQKGWLDPHIGHQEPLTGIKDHELEGRPERQESEAGRDHGISDHKRHEILGSEI